MRPLFHPNIGDVRPEAILHALADANRAAMFAQIVRAGFLGTPAAVAQTVPARPSTQDQAVLQQACAGDFLNFCAGIDPASPVVEACFARNAARLSPACGQAIQTYEQRAKSN